MSLSRFGLRFFSNIFSITPMFIQDIKDIQINTVAAAVCVLQVFGGRREMDSLKKELEEELKLSTDDLRSHAWYHGPITREVLNEPYFTCFLRNTFY